MIDGNATLAVITDGRRDCIEQTIGSALMKIVGHIDHCVIYDDSGSAENRAWLDARFGQHFTIIQHPAGRQGFGGAIRALWSWLRENVDDGYVFHLEDDFTFNRIVDVDVMASVLDHHHRPLAQVALKRQPWNEAEELAGGIVETDPGAFSDAIVDDVNVTIHRKFWTTNPSLYRMKLVREFDWPEGPHSEGRFGLELLEAGYDFAYLGRRFDPPLVHHIGATRVGKGY